MPTLRSIAPLDRLRDALRGSPALPALSGERYARTHATYEAASDQRPRLQEWVARELPLLLPGDEPLRVVGVGVGDGSVDAPLAAALAHGGRRVHYTGVEPHPASAAGFAVRLAALDAPSLTPTVVVGDFTQHDPGQPVDLVHFVHSLYYVADLSGALDHALSLLRPGGLLVAATAPLEPLCVLTQLLCPWTELRPWFAEDVRAELTLRGLDLRSETLLAHLDVGDVLHDPRGRGADVFDFLVGADTSRIPDAVLGPALAHLRGLVTPGGVTVPHPLDITITRRP